MLIFENLYKIDEIDKEGKIYASVSRAYGSDDHGRKVILDHHSILFKLQKQDSVSLELYTESCDHKSIDYQMNGVIYKVNKTDGDGVSLVMCSFGGLLLHVDVPDNYLSEIHPGMPVVLCASKI